MDPAMTLIARFRAERQIKMTQKNQASAGLKAVLFEPTVSCLRDFGSLLWRRSQWIDVTFRFVSKDGVLECPSLRRHLAHA